MPVPSVSLWYFSLAESLRISTLAAFSRILPYLKVFKPYLMAALHNAEKYKVTPWGTLKILQNIAFILIVIHKWTWTFISTYNETELSQVRSFPLKKEKKQVTLDFKWTQRWQVRDHLEIIVSILYILLVPQKCNIHNAFKTIILLFREISLYHSCLIEK